MSKSKHNYTQYSKKNDETYIAPEVEEVVESVDVMQMSVEPAALELVEETVETVTVPETVTGTVIGCTKLNVRAEPDITSTALCALDVASELVINVNDSTPEWFSVTTATGVEGYCMRKFVKTNL